VTDPAPAVYRPFPPFADWAGVPMDVDTINRYSALRERGYL